MNKITAILQSVRPELDFTRSSDFIEDGLLDSFDVALLVGALDKAYGISIEGVEIIPENFKNLQTIEALLRKHGVAE
jgi:acyl carrier protein